MLVTAAEAVTAAGAVIVIAAVFTVHRFRSLTLTVYDPAPSPVNIPFIEPVMLPGCSLSKYDNAPVPPVAVTVTLPSVDVLQLSWLPL